MSYFRKQLHGFGADEADCDATPDDPVCAAFYAKPTAAPVAAPLSIDAALGKVKDLFSWATGTPAPTPAVATATPAPTTANSSLLPVVLIGGGAVAAWYLLRKKK